VSFINSCIVNFLLILGKLNVLPICNKLETFGRIFVLERFMNHFSLVCSSVSLAFGENKEGDKWTLMSVSLVDVKGFVSVHFINFLVLSLTIQEKLISLISFVFFWIVWCNNQSNFFLCMKNIFLLNLLNKIKWCL